ncbi:MAG: ROK family protein [Burkholderiaceae bacterium]|nr:ROK family protein [Burkholderiaceae bacterium]
MNQFIALDIGGSKSRIALIEDGTIAWRNEIATAGSEGPEAMLAQMIELVRPLNKLDAPIGVAITGQIVAGCVTAHNTAVLPGWREYPLRLKLSEALDRPVAVVNDARAAAWGEYLYGAGRGMSEFLFLTVSTGVGAGLVLNGRLHLAKNGFDAEIGEMPMQDGATLEDHASGTALGRYAAQLGYAGAEELCDAADGGDVRAEDVYMHGIREIARKLADLAVMLGIERVALGGSVGLRPGYLERMRREMQTYRPIQRYELARAALGADAGLFGAAALASAHS